MPKVQKIDPTSESSRVRRKTRKGRRKSTKGLTKQAKHEQRIVQKAVAAVKRSIPSGPLAQKAKKIILRGNHPSSTAKIPQTLWHPLYQHHADTVAARLPITWAIPTQQPSGTAADDRWRESRSVYVTGVRIRFAVRCMATVRVRMVVFQPDVPFPFESASVPTTTVAGQLTQGMDQAFNLTYYEPSSVTSVNSKGVVTQGLDIKPNGPFEWINLANTQTSPKVPVSTPMWMLNSSDGTLFTADLAKNEHRPIGDYVWSSKHSGQAVTMENLTSTQKVPIQHIDWNEIDWYCPIGRVAHFQREMEKTVYDKPYEALLFLDAPAAIEGAASGSVQIGTISVPQITVYYR